MTGYQHVCAHRGEFMHQAGLWDGNPPGVRYTSPTDGSGRIAPGAAGEDREAEFHDWYRAKYGAGHTDPCDGSTAVPAVYRPADQAVIEDGGALRLVVMMDEEPPPDSNYRIQLLAPVSAEAGQPASLDIYWRSQRPPGWPRTVRTPK